MLVARGILASAVLAAVAGIGVVPVFEAGETRRIEDCAANATVLFTCVDARFALNARRLAESVRAVGEFPAVLAVVQGDAFLDALPRALALQVRLAPAVAGALLPGPVWCSDAELVELWGWRRTQLYKVAAYELLLARGLSVLTVDADWTMARPALARVAAARADVVGFADRRYQSGRYVNFGLHWTRATPATARLAARVANRSAQAWDQFVWNVELAAAAGTGGVACCARGDGALVGAFEMNRTAHMRKASRDGGGQAPAAERACHAHERALAPPSALGFEHPAWNASRFNVEGWRTGRVVNPCVSRACASAPVAASPAPAGGACANTCDARGAAELEGARAARFVDDLRLPSWTRAQVAAEHAELFEALRPLADAREPALKNPCWRDASGDSRCLP